MELRINPGLLRVVKVALADASPPTPALILAKDLATRGKPRRMFQAAQTPAVLCLVLARLSAATTTTAHSDN